MDVRFVGGLLDGTYIAEFAAPEELELHTAHERYRRVTPSELGKPAVYEFVDPDGSPKAKEGA